MIRVIKMICIPEREYRMLLVKERAYEWIKKQIFKRKIAIGIKG
jgi:hypothetical protein